jgi:hypothetical protein
MSEPKNDFDFSEKGYELGYCLWQDEEADFPSILRVWFNPKLNRKDRCLDVVQRLKAAGLNSGTASSVYLTRDEAIAQVPAHVRFNKEAKEEARRYLENRTGSF